MINWPCTTCVAWVMEWNIFRTGHSLPGQASLRAPFTSENGANFTAVNRWPYRDFIHDVLFQHKFLIFATAKIGEDIIQDIKECLNIILNFFIALFPSMTHSQLVILCVAAVLLAGPGTKKAKGVFAILTHTAKRHTHNRAAFSLF